MTSNHTCCTKQRVKRGLWSPEEDEKLLNYIATHGHGCWSTIPRLAGLQRCGKSCRLRWINYLRPDLKRGNFTPREASLIIELHRVLGNRWSQIARHLPGRTDNEVKNFWNSNIKRKLLAHQSIFSSDPHLTALTAFTKNKNALFMNNNNNNIPNNNLIMKPMNMMMMMMSPNSQLHQLYGPTPPPLIQNYNFALMPPPSIHGSPASSSDLPPLPVSCNNITNPIPPNYQEDDNDFMSGLKLDDQDLDLLDALVPQFCDIAKVIESVFPDSPSLQGQQILDPAPKDGAPGFIDAAGIDSGSGPLHPNHIRNIESLMESFAPAGGDDCQFLPAPPPCTTDAFLGSPSLHVQSGAHSYGLFN